MILEEGYRISLYFTYPLETCYGILWFSWYLSFFERLLFVTVDFGHYSRNCTMLHSNADIRSLQPRYKTFVCRLIGVLWNFSTHYFACIILLFIKKLLYLLHIAMWVTVVLLWALGFFPVLLMTGIVFKLWFCLKHLHDVKILQDCCKNWPMKLSALWYKYCYACCH